MAAIDGTGLIFGRLATHIAKRLINGEDIALINAEKIVMTGRPEVTIEKFKKRRGARNKATPEHSPSWSKLPHLLVKKMIRGMLPRRTSRGSQALKRLMVYTGNPKNLNAVSIPDIECDKSKPFIVIEYLCKMM